MKNITKVKIILIIIMGIMLLAIPANVFAATSDPTDLNNYLDDWKDLELEDEDDQTPTTPTTPTTPSTPTTPTTPTTPSTPTTPTTPTTPSTSTPENSYSDAGLVEDTIMVVSIIVLGTIAVYAYRKINQYNNI